MLPIQRGDRSDPRKPWQFSHGVFQGAEWKDVNFFRANLDRLRLFERKFGQRRF